MVAQERIKCAEIEEELRQVRQEKEALKCAMQIIEQENTRLKSPIPPPSETVASSLAEDGEPTPRTSRPVTPGLKRETSASPIARSPVSDRPADAAEVDEARSQSPLSSTRGIRERSSSPEGSVNLSSPSPESEFSVSLDVNRNHVGEISTSVPEVHADERETQEADAASLSGDSSGSATKSPFLDMPAPESPWSKI